MQLPGVIAGAGPIVDVAAGLACLYFGVRLTQIVRQLLQGDKTETAFRQLRADIKEDLGDQFQYANVHLELVVKDAIREALR